MKTLILITALLLGAFQTQAQAQEQAQTHEQTLLCRFAVQDASLSVQLIAGSQYQAREVRLFVPTGETSGDTHIGIARPTIGNAEFDYQAQLVLSAENGTYNVRVFSFSATDLVATVIRTDMGGTYLLTPLPLPCSKL